MTIAMLQKYIGDQEFKAILKRCKVRRIAVFGSYATGKATNDSDIDFLVEFESGADLFDQVGLKVELEDFLHKKVDVVTPRAISPYLREKIIQSAVYL